MGCPRWIISTLGLPIRKNKLYHQWHIDTALSIINITTSVKSNQNYKLTMVLFNKINHLELNTCTNIIIKNCLDSTLSKL